MPLISALSVASQSLLTHKRAISAVSTNISNVYTEDYARQLPEFADIQTGGVFIENIRRIFDRAYFKRYISTNQQYSSLNTYKNILEQVEYVFNDEQGSGFGKEITDFFLALNDIILNPDDISARTAFISKAKALVGRIRDSYKVLTEIRTNAIERLHNVVDVLNDKLSALAEVNENIRFFGDAPERLNQYLDRRDRLIKEISSLVDTKIVFNDDGTVNLYTAKGFPLVMEDRSYPIEVKLESADDPRVYATSVDITENFENGEIGGILKGVRFLNEVIDRLNTFTKTFANKINEIHETGYNLYGETNVAFFVAENGAVNIDASNIALAFEDPKKISAAKLSTNIPADNEKAKELLALQDQTFSELSDMSFQEFYASKLNAYVGSELQHIKEVTKDTKFLLESAEEKLKEISGVNLDEELINLTKYQRAYEAAARVVTVTDELLQTILNMKR